MSNFRESREELLAHLRESELGLDGALEAIKKYHLVETRPLLTQNEHNDLEAFFRAVSLEALGIVEAHKVADDLG